MMRRFAVLLGVLACITALGVAGCGSKTSSSSVSNGAGGTSSAAVRHKRNRRAPEPCREDQVRTSSWILSKLFSPITALAGKVSALRSQLLHGKYNAADITGFALTMKNSFELTDPGSIGRSNT